MSENEKSKRYLDEFFNLKGMDSEIYKKFSTVGNVKKTDQNTSDKQIKVPAEIHQEIKILAAAEGREMREIVTTAFEFYRQHRNSINDND